MSLVDKVKDALKGVVDPETGMSVVDMKLIKDLTVTEEGEIRLKFRPTSFLCPLAFKLAFDIYRALETAEGVKGLAVEVVDCVYAKEINSFLKTGKEQRNANL